MMQPTSDCAVTDAATKDWGVFKVAWFTEDEEAAGEENKENKENKENTAESKDGKRDGKRDGKKASEHDSTSKAVSIYRSYLKFTSQQAVLQVC